MTGRTAAGAHVAGAVATEVLKLRRSRTWWLGGLAMTVAGGVGAMFMFIGQDPERARSLGLLGTKAQLADIDATWAGYLALLAQTVAVGGMLVFGVTTIWIFGREFSDRTAKDLLALPNPRWAIVIAKFAVAAGWCLLLVGYVFVLGLGLGALLDLPGWSAAAAGHGLAVLMAAGGLTVLLCSTFGLAASIGRGYLAPVGVMFVVFFCAQVVAALGYGRSFPYSVPALLTGLTGPDQAPPGVVGYLLVSLVAGAAVGGTVAWWARADQTG